MYIWVEGKKRIIKIKKKKKRIFLTICYLNITLFWFSTYSYMRLSQIFLFLHSTVTDIPIFPFKSHRYSYFSIFFPFHSHRYSYFSIQKSQICLFVYLCIWQTYLKSYSDISKVNFYFDKHTQSHIWICLKSTFPLTKIFKLIFGNV
jgi:hypothetical protein